MKSGALKSQSAKTALAAVGVIALAIAFWLLLLAPKREKVDELTKQTDQLSVEVATEEQRAAQALAAKESFPEDYQQLVLLGKAVPAEAATPSLLVQLSGISARSSTQFQSITLGKGSGEASGSTEGGTDLPLGASVGPAGFSAMPYALVFDGGFFQIADFIEGLDSLVQTEDGVVDAKGRLVTIDGFNIAPDPEANERSSRLRASFAVTTYVTPPGQGLTAGATAEGPGSGATSTTTSTTP